jgi:hypothetical protein
LPARAIRKPPGPPEAGPRAFSYFDL